MRSLWRSLWILCATVLLTLTLAPSAQSAALRWFPDRIALPDGWQGEGIAAGPGTTVYAGDRATGAVWRGDIRTGDGRVLVPGQGRAALGLKYSKGLLFVAGGPTGRAFVYDARTGGDVVEGGCPLALEAPTFVNDVVVTRDAAYFTNSLKAELYRVPIDRRGPDCTGAEAIPLTGDWQQVSGFNANGIEVTNDGKTLIVVQSATGKLFRVSSESGTAAEIALDEPLTNGDGLLLRGRTLFVVQNQLQQIGVLRLSPDLSSGWPITVIRNDALFAVPTTVAAFGPALYVVNARFGQTNATSDIVRAWP